MYNGRGKAEILSVFLTSGKQSDPIKDSHTEKTKRRSCKHVLIRIDVETIVAEKVKDTLYMFEMSTKAGAGYKDKDVIHIHKTVRKALEDLIQQSFEDTSTIR